MEKADKMKDQIGNFTDMEIIRQNQLKMLELKTW